MELTKDYFVNENSLCIFTDSCCKDMKYIDHRNKKHIHKKVHVTAPAVLCYFGTNPYPYRFGYVDYCDYNNTSSDKGELMAVNLALNKVAEFKSCGQIGPSTQVRIISDSIYAIESIRNSVPAWIRTHTLSNGMRSNPDLLSASIFAIDYLQMPIEFWHINGHIGERGHISLSEAIPRFRVHNNQDVYPSVDLIRYLSAGNKAVDLYSNQLIDWAISGLSGYRGYSIKNNYMPAVKFNGFPNEDSIDLDAYEKNVCRNLYKEEPIIEKEYLGHEH